MKKNKGKKIFGLILMFIIFTAILLSVFLCDSSRLGEANVFSLEINEMEENFDWKYIKRIDADAYIYNGPLITDKLVNEIMDIGGIKDVVLGTKVSVLMEYITFPGQGVAGWDYEIKRREAEKGYGVSFQSGYSPVNEDKYNVLRGYNDTSKADYFRTGSLKLVDGKHITDEDGYKVLISEELAETNHLSVGDTINTKMRLYDSLQDGLGSTNMEIDLEVAGIFKVVAEQNLEGYPLKEDVAVNYMFVNNKTVFEYDQLYRQIFILDETPVYTSAEFFVRNPLRLDGIMDKAEEAADDTYFSAEKTVEIDKNLAKAYRRINRTSFALAGWFGLTGFVLLIMFFRKGLFKKKDLAALVAAMVLATGAAFVGTGFAGNLMMKFIGVETSVEEEKDPMEVPLTEQELRKYYKAYELKSNVVEAGAFQRDVSVVMLAAGEVALVVMCGLAFVIGKKR